MRFSRKPKRWLLPFVMSVGLLLLLLYRYFASDEHSWAFISAITLSLIGCGYSATLGIKIGFFEKDT